MKNTTRRILIGVIVAVVLIVVFNLLPDGIRIASTISAGIGFVAGIFGKKWYDNETRKEEEPC